MMNIEKLEKTFDTAIEHGFSYVAVVIQMSDFKTCEVIINPIDNAIDKLEYYKNTYNDDLTHKHAKDKIRIIDATFADTFDEIEDDFKAWMQYVNESI